MLQYYKKLFRLRRIVPEDACQRKVIAAFKYVEGIGEQTNIHRCVLHLIEIYVANVQIELFVPDLSSFCFCHKGKTPFRLLSCSTLF